MATEGDYIVSLSARQYWMWPPCGIHSLRHTHVLVTSFVAHSQDEMILVGPRHKNVEVSCHWNVGFFKWNNPLLFHVSLIHQTGLWRDSFDWMGRDSTTFHISLWVGMAYVCYIWQLECYERSSGASRRCNENTTMYYPPTYWLGSRLCAHILDGLVSRDFYQVGIQGSKWLWFCTMYVVIQERDNQSGWYILPEVIVENPFLESIQIWNTKVCDGKRMNVLGIICLHAHWPPLKNAKF
jgi:hypothetical protein